MFLEWILKLGFLNEDPDSGLYLSFPKETRRVLAKEVVEHLLNDPEANAKLTHSMHVHVVMETVGQAFGLDVDDAPIISRATDLYRKWLFDGDRRPLPIVQQEQDITIKICKHFSLLFALRPFSKPNQLEIHGKLCSAVLDIYEGITRELGLRFSQENWHTFLKIILGICDYLLKSPEDQSPLANMLCPQLTRVLFSSWIRSQSMNDTMWKTLRELVGYWRHRMPVIQQWNNVCNGLTLAVVKNLYVTQDPKPLVQILGPGDIAVRLDAEYLNYAWYRTLHILGDLELLTDQDIYFEAMRGLHNVCSIFLFASKGRFGVDNGPKPPDGNLILHIFGPFFFDAVNIYRPGFERGKAEAFEALCQIFATKSDTEFLPEYLAAFYRGLELGIQQDNALMDVIVRNSIQFFPSELKGCRILVPCFLNAIHRVLVEPGWSRLDRIRQPSTELRRACYKIAGYMLTISHLFKQIPFQASRHLVEPFGYSTFDDLRKLRDVLLYNLNKEIDDENKKLLMWTLETYIYESVISETANDFPSRFIKTLISRLVQPDAWSTPVVLTALRVLTDLSQLYHHLSRDNPQSAPYLVKELCIYLESQIKKQVKEGKIDEEFIVTCYQCIGEWVLQGQWFVQHQEPDDADKKTIPQRVFEILEIGITGRKGVMPIVINVEKEKRGSDTVVGPKETGLKDSQQLPSTPSREEVYYFEPPPSIKETAESIMLNIINRLGHFPPSKKGPSVVSSLLTEQNILSSVKNSQLSVFVSDNTILSLIRHPRDASGHFTVTAILRDMTGKYVWNAHLRYPPTNLNAPRWMPTTTKKNPLERPPPDPPDKKFLDDLLNFITDEERKKHDIILNKAHDRIQQEQAILRKKGFGLTGNVAVTQPPLPLVEPHVDTTPLRLFLNHFGFFEIFMRTRFYPVKPNENLAGAFQQVDLASERDNYTIGVLYIRNGKKTEKEIFAVDNTEVTKEYLDFLSNLGWEVELARHVGFKGNLRPEVTGPFARYYATHNLEIIFHVATMMPNNPNTDQEHKRNLINFDRVLIVWVENIWDYNDTLFSHSRAVVKVVVNPMTSDLYRIRIYYDKEKMNIGPLTDESVVSKHVLATTVRQTALAASILERDRDLPRPYPFFKSNPLNGTHVTIFLRKFMSISLTVFFVKVDY
jgi:hypothetical protein